MKTILLLQIFVISTLSSSVFAYSGCREIYREYDTEIWSKYNIDIGNGNDIYLVLRCTSDCYNLSMGGDRSGNASLCGTKKPEGSWAYSSCGSNTKSAPYGTGTTDASNLMLSYCNEVSNRKIDRKNADARRWNKKIARDGLDSSKKIIPETQDRIKSVNSLIDIYSDTSEKSICLKNGVIKLKKALSLFISAKEKYRKALNSDSNVGNYYEQAKELYNKGIGEYNTSTKSCFSDSEKTTKSKSSSGKKENSKGSSYSYSKKLETYSIIAKPHLNIRSKATITSSTIGKVKYGESILLIESSSNKVVLSGKEGHWVKIRHNSIEGYVFDAYLKHINIVFATINATPHLNMRASKSTKSKVVNTINNGYQIKSSDVINIDQNKTIVAGKKGRWIKLRHEAIEGYVFDAFLILE